MIVEFLLSYISLTKTMMTHFIVLWLHRIRFPTFGYSLSFIWWLNGLCRLKESLSLLFDGRVASTINEDSFVKYLSKFYCHKRFSLLCWMIGYLDHTTLMWFWLWHMPEYFSSYIICLLIVEATIANPCWDRLVSCYLFGYDRVYDLPLWVHGGHAFTFLISWIKLISCIIKIDMIDRSCSSIEEVFWFSNCHDIE